MGDWDSDDWKAYREAQREDREENRQLAHSDYPTAATLAAKNGMLLKRFSDVHYQLFPRGKGWIINLYPGNGRIYSDPNKPGPYLAVPTPWTLTDAVQAAVDILKRQSEDHDTHETEPT